MKRVVFLLISLLVIAGIAGFVGTTFNEDTDSEVLTKGYQFTEGPYWHQDGYLLFSDIPANKIYKWEPGSGAEVFLDSSGYSNGIAGGTDGSLILAQHSGKVSKLTKDHELKTLVDNYKGKRLNSPNDLTVHSNGTIYFTDPPYGVSEEERELDFSGVYRLSSDGELSMFYDEFSRPNGIVLSPDQSKLYVNDTQTGDIMMFDVDRKGIPSNPRKFASVGPSDKTGGADGMAIDTNGRILSTGPGGFYIFDTSGNQIRMVKTKNRITNLAWGSDNLKDLYLTAPDRVLRVSLM